MSRRPTYNAYTEGKANGSRLYFIAVLLLFLRATKNRSTGFHALTLGRRCSACGHPPLCLHERLARNAEPRPPRWPTPPSTAAGTRCPHASAQRIPVECEAEQEVYVVLSLRTSDECFRAASMK